MPGDILGILISLPQLTNDETAVLENRRWKYITPYARFPEKEPLPKKLGSEIRYFKNGIDLGVAFSDLMLGE